MNFEIPANSQPHPEAEISKEKALLRLNNCVSASKFESQVEGNEQPQNDAPSNGSSKNLWGSNSDQLRNNIEPVRPSILVPGSKKRNSDEKVKFDALNVICLENKRQGQQDIEANSLKELTLKSCHDFVKVHAERSDMSYKDTEEESPKSFSVGSDSVLQGKKDGARKEKPEICEPMDWDKRERLTQCLRETVAETRWSAFQYAVENVKAAAKGRKSQEDLTGIQREYNCTLEGISDIWHNTAGLITCVKNHVLDKAHDSEHLTLEAEMLQLCVDFAVSYSKMKTEFLIKSIQKRFNVKDFNNSDLENFMNSKTYMAMYNEEDLKTMARTVQDLYDSMRKDVPVCKESS